MVLITTEVALKVFGYKKTGKSHILNLVKEFLESKGYSVIFNARLDDETIHVKYSWEDTRFPELNEDKVFDNEEGVDLDGVN